MNDKEAAEMARLSALWQQEFPNGVGITSLANFLTEAGIPREETLAVVHNLFGLIEEYRNCCNRAITRRIHGE